MPKNSEFPFKTARRITEEEVIAAEKAIKEQFNIEINRKGRPAKQEIEKYKTISIRLHPQVIQWAQKEAKNRGVGYQTVINEELLKLATP